MVLLFWIAFLLLLFLFGSFLTKLFPASWERFIYGIFGTGAAILGTSFFLKHEKKSFRDIGLVWQGKTIVRFLGGLLCGTLIMVFILSVLLAFTELEFERNNTDISIWQA
jgi:hypothetical protein